MSTSSVDEGKRRKALIRHINNVRENCEKLAEVLIDKGEPALGLHLMANGHCHDQSKFHGIEWLYLNEESKEQVPILFNAALTQHVTSNRHHPEAWVDGIHSMDRLHLAEMVCDLAARSSEFGTDLRDFLKNKACKKYGMTVQSQTYRNIKGFVDLLLDPGFK